jgi:predicted glycoside hydrolase/deacetylase ChbG (UPF0249 family)
MVAGPAAQDAVTRARKLPRLRIGLHVCWSKARPCARPTRVPGLVDAKGYFRTDMARLGLDIALRRDVRRQLGPRSKPQFEALPRYRILTLDHVNAHSISTYIR